MALSCDDVDCTCPEGQNYSQENTIWESVLCNICHLHATHFHCANLPPNYNGEWQCRSCNQEDNAFKTGVYGESKNSGEIAGDNGTNFSLTIFPKMPHRKTRKKAGKKINSLSDVAFTDDEKSDASTSQGIESVYRCNIDDCTAVFSKPFNLKTHKRTHFAKKTSNKKEIDFNAAFAQSFLERTEPIAEKRYKCDFEGCPVAFTCSSHLKVHKRTHTGERPHKCDFEGCDASFAQTSTLRTHKRLHSGEKPYKCHDCPASFMYSSSLKTHKLIHTGEKPYACEFPGCKAAFTCSSHLKMHRGMHTGEKPHKCEFENCNSTFLRPSDLKSHQRKHTGERPFKCNFDGCKSAFTYSSSLKSHKRLHTGEKPYKCDGCDATFSYSSNLKVHRQTHVAKKLRAALKKSK